MATERARLPHEERTADEPRDPNLHAVILKRIQDVNSNIRLFRLSAKDQTEGILVCVRLIDEITKQLTSSTISKVSSRPMA